MHRHGSTGTSACNRARLNSRPVLLQARLRRLRCCPWPTCVVEPQLASAPPLSVPLVDCSLAWMEELIRVEVQQPVLAGGCRLPQRLSQCVSLPRKGAGRGGEQAPGLICGCTRQAAKQLTFPARPSM